MNRLRILLPALVIFTTAYAPYFAAAAVDADCDPLGWFPTAFGLKDHAVFTYDGYTYIAATSVPNETRFAYARSLDLCHWEELSNILTVRTAGAPDELVIWAPFVYEESGVYYMFYTGVNSAFSQSMMLATSSNPADPASWAVQGVVFQPTHPNAVWSVTSWSDNRDPAVIKHNGVYYMYYTGRDTGGGIIGVATAPSLLGPWTDLGATFGPVLQRTFESPAVFSAWGKFYMVYHTVWTNKSYGVSVRTADSPVGPWTPAQPIFTGWAHEFWQESGGDWYTSYLTYNNVTIVKLQWDMDRTPPLPAIDGQIFKSFLPITVNR